MNIDQAYKERIESEFGRKIEKGDVQCRMCNGNGFNQFEDPCENCDGKRFTIEWVFSDCGHEVESEDCIDEGCLLCATQECENNHEPNNDWCAECLAVAAYWKAQYDREHFYTREEIMDCYSEPSEKHKKDSLLEKL